jgi:putative heme-binding domain-containing protein
LGLAFDTRVDSRSRADMIAREAVTRLNGDDIAPETPQAKALAALLDRQRGTSLFVELVERFKLTDRNGELLAMAIASPDSQAGVEAISALLALEQTELIQSALASKDPVQAAAVTTALAASRDGRAAELLLAAMNDTSRDLELRRQAARGLSKLQNGAQRLIRMARDGELDEQLRSAVAFSLHSAPWGDIRQEAEQLFPLPPVKGDDPLPSVERLVRMRGDVAQGKRVFDTTGTCANCHQVSGQGKQVGPDLTEIGSKLSREALFESILYPSAGISHSYETYVLALTTGNIVSGILVSETPQAVIIRTDDAITRTFARGEIEQMRQQPVSLMPADLQKTMSTDDLADVVAYMETLRAAGQ